MSQPDDSISGHANSWEGQGHLRSGLGYTTEPDYFEDGEARYERSLSFSNTYSVFDDIEMSHEHRTGDVANVLQSGWTLGAFRVYMSAPGPVLSDAAAAVSPPTTFTRFSIPGEPRFGASLYGVSDVIDDLDNDLQAIEDGMSDNSDETAAADDLSMSEDDTAEGQENVDDNDLEMSEDEEASVTTTEEILVQVTSFLDLLEEVRGDCPICLGEAGHGPILVHLPCSPTGGHAFHRACIGRWLQSRSNCPYCRHSFEELEWEDIEWEDETMEWMEDEEEEEEADDDDDDDEEFLSNQLRQIGIPIPLQGLRGGDDAARSLTELEIVRSWRHTGPRGKTVAPSRLGDLLCVCVVSLLDAAFIFHVLGPIRT